MLPKGLVLLVLTLCSQILCIDGKCTAKVLSAEPAFSQFAGGVSVNVTGRGFADYGDVKCRFGLRLMPATVVSSTMLRCIAPANIESQRPRVVVPLEITLNGVEFTHSMKEFTYFEGKSVMISLLTPDGGPIAGGTTVTVHGTNFFTGKHLNCSWNRGADDRLVVPATFLSRYAISCVTPVIERSIAYTFHTPLELTFDGTIYTKMNKTFSFYDPAELGVWSVSPSGGPLSGGTTVDIIGEGFVKMGGILSDPSCVSGVCTTDAGVYCQFGGSALTEATWVTSNRMKCRAPVYTGELINFVGEVRVEVTLNGQDMSTNGANYSYYDSRELRLQYMDISGGPTIGDTTITIVGKLFHDYGFLRCRFGWVGQTNATRIDETHVSCNSPTIYGTGHFQAVDVDITMNDQDYTTNQLEFTYFPLNNYTIANTQYNGVMVKRLQPFGGPQTGATVVTVVGLNFEQYGLLSYETARPVLCKFGHLTAVAATFLNTSAVKCASPECIDSVDGSSTCHVATNGYHEVLVDVTLNNQEAALTNSGVVYTYYGKDVLQVSWIYPQAGPKAGGNTVTVFGSGFRDLGRHQAGTKCRFGTMDMVTATIEGVPATNTSLPTKMTCIAPAYSADSSTCEDPAQVCVEVTNNNDTAALTTNCVKFTYFDYDG